MLPSIGDIFCSYVVEQKMCDFNEKCDNAKADPHENVSTH